MIDVNKVSKFICKEAESEITRICNDNPDAFPDLLRTAMSFAYADASRRCDDYAMSICEDEDSGSRSHYAACRSLAHQIKTCGA